jgi:glycosyltransferase involved in cell wall biosynthesis
MNKPKLLFLSPCVPAATGGGSAMRASVFLEIFSVSYDVVLLVLPVFEVNGSPWPDMAERYSYAREIVSLERIRTWLDKRGPLLLEMAHEIHRIHVFKLFSAPMVTSYLDMGRCRPICTLDMDDFESKTCNRIADLYEANGYRSRAAHLRARADVYARLERDYLGRFDTVYLSQPDDQLEVSDRYACNNTVLAPNVIRLPTEPVIRRKTGACTLLFVGSFHYYPNQDAVLWFCSDILPLIRKRANAGFRFSIVGRQPAKRLLALLNIPEITIQADVPATDPFYAEADIVVVPIRAGGGTRIKILEAFSFGCSVVTTSMGAEGLDIHHEEELLIADNANEFADRCIQLMHDPEKRERMGRRAIEWVSNHHTSIQMAKVLRSPLTNEENLGRGVCAKELNFPSDAIPLLDTFPD